MTVWIVNPFDTLPTEGHRPLRYWLMSEAFARAGHSVTYWTADFNHVTKKPRDVGEDGSRHGFRVVAVHEPPYESNISLRRLWAHWRWARNWRRAAAREEVRPDLVVVSSPPLAIGAEARKVAKACGARLVVDVMDAWPETFERVAPRWALWPLRSLVRRNYLAADAVTAVADGYLETVRGYGCRREARRFYHGIRVGAPAERAPDAARPPKIVYAGNLGRTYDLMTAMEAVALLDGATLEIAGKGDCEADLRSAAKVPRMEGRVSFRGYLGEAELEAFLASGDIGLVPMAPESCVGIPYKLADYARAGLAVASSLGGESDRLLARYGAGTGYRPGDAKSLAEAVRRLVPRLAEAKRASRRMAESEFDASRIYGDYVRFACGEGTS